MYPIVLAVHNIIRWVALILGIVVTVLSFLGWLQNRPWANNERKFGMYYTSALDIQLLLGLVLYLFLSPITRTALQNFGSMMGNADLRFFGLEHAFYMILAVVFGHLGSALSKRAPDDKAKYRRAAIWYALSLLMIFLGMPWFRPLLPGF
jgi:hypothetical protein